MKNNGPNYRSDRAIRFILTILLVGCTLQGYAQSKPDRQKSIGKDTLVGKVIDATNSNVLVGASIKTLDGRHSAMTDENGIFHLNMPSEKSTVVVTAPGFVKKEVLLYHSAPSKTIAILPTGNSNYFSDVETLFGTVRKTTNTTSVRTLNTEAPTLGSMDALINANLSGDLQLTPHSGGTYSGSAMLLRGINSINGGNQPLIVVDGMILCDRSEESSIHQGNSLNPFSTFDVNDIQSISVIKDGTSLYGSKGSNGVLLIKTNRGKSEVTRINVSSQFGYQTRPTTTPMLNADGYRLYLSDLIKNDDARNSLSNEFFLKDDKKFIYYERYHNNTDWTDGIYRDATSQNYHVDVNGGDEMALYNLSLGLTNATGTLQENAFNRLNARFNSDIRLTNDLSVSFDIMYTQAERTLRNDGLAESYNSQMNSPGFIAMIKSPFLYPYQYSNTRELTAKLEDYDFMKIANPYAILQLGVGESSQMNFNMSITPKLVLNRHLTLTSQFSYNMRKLSENLFSPMFGVAPFVDLDKAISSKNHVKNQFVNQNSLFSDTRLSWVKKWNEHSVNLNGGLRFISESYKAEYAFGHNTGSDQVREMSSSLLYKSVNGTDDPYKLLTGYALLDYGFQDKYFVEACLSMESSSRFGNQIQSAPKFGGVNWALFPSVNVGWVISSEDFLRDLDGLDQLKLRAGIGQSGNDNIANASNKTYFEAVRYVYTATGLAMRNLANPGVRWETVLKKNVGMDASLFDGRVQLAVDLYDNRTDNLLMLKAPAVWSGMPSYWTNNGSLSNKGYEVNLQTTLLRWNDLSISAGGMISHYSNKILSLADGDYLTSVYGGEILTAVGQPMGQFYGYETKGVYATTEEASNANMSVRNSTGALLPLAAGDVRFVNRNSDQVIDEKDKTVIGNPNPDFFGSIFAAARYKNLGLKAVFNYSYGNDAYNYLRSQIESGSTFYNQSRYMSNRWMTEGQVTNLPKSSYGDPKGNNRFSDRWIEDASYIRLKTVELTYEIPVRKMAFLQGLTVWVSADNVWTFSKYLGSDPEFSTSNQIYYRGIDTGLLPQSKGFNAGVRFNL
jgi:TonB-linked SusC/RagA family outer membrane protein